MPQPLLQPPLQITSIAYRSHDAKNLSQTMVYGKKKAGAVFVQQSCEALSPALVFGLWKALGFDLSLSFAETTYPDQLAFQIFALVLPLSLLQYAVGLRAIRPLFHEQVAKWFPPPLNLRD